MSLSPLSSSSLSPLPEVASQSEVVSTSGLETDRTEATRGGGGGGGVEQEIVYGPQSFIGVHFLGTCLLFVSMRSLTGPVLDRDLLSSARLLDWPVPTGHLICLMTQQPKISKTKHRQEMSRRFCLASLQSTEETPEAIMQLLYMDNNDSALYQTDYT